MANETVRVKTIDIKTLVTQLDPTRNARKDVEYVFSNGRKFVAKTENRHPYNR